MKIRTYARGGGSFSATGEKDVEELIRSLVQAMCEEHFSRPDFGHRQMSVTNEDDWTITVHLEGEISLYQDELRGPVRYLFDLPPKDLVNLLLDLARRDTRKVLARKWVTKRDRYFYLYASEPRLPDLFRAVGSGDIEWVKAELAAGANVNARHKRFATPLHHAALCGWSEICRILLAAGANPGAKVNKKTPADFADMADENLPANEVAELVALLEEAAKRKK